MTGQQKRGFLVIVMAIAALCSLTVEPAIAKKQEKPVIERFRANAMNVERGRATMLDITIHEWTSPEERQAVIQAFSENGNRGLYDFIADQQEKGYLQVPGSLGYDMRYAYQFEADGKRRIVLATDRPILMGELRRGSRTTAYSISLVVLELDAATGKGTGTLAMGAEFSVDKETWKLVIEIPGAQPTHLTNVRSVKK